MTDDARLRAARADIPFLDAGLHMDSASVPPLPRRVQMASDRFDTLTSERLRESLSGGAGGTRPAVSRRKPGTSAGSAG